MSPSVAAGAVKHLRSSNPCAHPSKKHHFRVHSFIPGEASILQCQKTGCGIFYVVSHEEVSQLVAA